MKISKDEITSYLNELFPDAHCELNYDSIFHLLLAVMLSAQTTDNSVNKVTPELFLKYPTPKDLMNASLTDVENIIHSIGLYKNKAKNLIATSKIIYEKYNSIVPSTIEELTSLPGVGRKTANVVLVEGYKIPAFPVDTHVERISKRLGIAKIDDSVQIVEKKIKKIYASEQYGLLHHQFIFFGRYFCKALKPNCENCKFLGRCLKK